VKEINHFIEMSKYAGARFDLVQAGGGNTSVKLNDGKMIIKSSGFHLSEMEYDNGFTIVDVGKILDILNDEQLVSISDKRERSILASKNINNAVLENGKRPSIETLMHVLMKKYTLHIHPLVVNAIVCRKDWKEQLGKFFSNAVLVEYRTPGFDLALEVKTQLESKGAQKESVECIFLQNHGLIISSDRYSEVIETNEQVLTLLEEFLCLDMYRYKLGTQISNLINQTERNKIVYLSEDKELCRIIDKRKELVFTPPFCPDTLVFCGVSVLELENSQDFTSLKKYTDQFKRIPPVILCEGHLYFVAQNVRKARDCEEVFKLHVLALDTVQEGNMANIQNLSESEINYLSNWESEKYRQKM